MCESTCERVRCWDSLARGRRVGVQAGVGKGLGASGRTAPRREMGCPSIAQGPGRMSCFPEMRWSSLGQRVFVCQIERSHQCRMAISYTGEMVKLPYFSNLILEGIYPNVPFPEIEAGFSPFALLTFRARESFVGAHPLGAVL